MILKKTARFHIDKFMTNFKVEDFFCRCMKCNDKPQKIDLMLPVMLQRLRTLVQRPVIINNAFRCVDENLLVGGASKSPHLEGLAADIYCTGMSGYDLARAAWEVGFRRIGIAQNWCHVDVNKTSGDYDFWTYAPLNIVEVQNKFLKDVGYGV